MYAKYCELMKRYLETTDKYAEAHCTTFRQLCMKSLRYETYGVQTDVLEKRINSLSDQLLSHIKAECRVTVDNFTLGEKLRDLEKLIKEQEKYKGTLAWRPSGIPDQDFEDHLCEIYENALRCLTSKLKAHEEKNKALQEEVSRGNKELQSISIDIELTRDKMNKLYISRRKAAECARITEEWSTSI